MPDQRNEPNPPRTIPYHEAGSAPVFGRGTGGYLVARGLAVSRSTGAIRDVIELRPVGARGPSSACLIEIPPDAAILRAVIDALQRFLPPEEGDQIHPAT
jgi:hypothetical protein